MLELYHHGSSVCAAKVRLMLAEKDLEWHGRYIDILRGEQFSAEYMRLNEKAVVPTLVHNGQAIVESTVICEYLEDVFPERRCIPTDPLDRARMRLWTKAVDELLHPACAEITFASSHRHSLARLSERDLQAFLDSTPPLSVTAEWHERKKAIVLQGYDAPGISRSLLLYDSFLQKMEATLQDWPWLAGRDFSLADIAMMPYVNRLDMMAMSEMWTRYRPRVTDWFSRARKRRSFQPAVLDWCPSELTHDLRTFGSQSWPRARKILHEHGAFGAGMDN